MKKYSFYNDYSEGAHPRLLEIIQKTNFHQQSGYGEDELCVEAARLIQDKLNSSNAAVHFLSGGTQANLIALASALKPFESVIAATSAHIHVHEAGAVEATGHKINVVPTEDGKLTPDQILEVVDQHTDEHMVRPRLVFISNATELGTIYMKAELEQISEFCRTKNLYLYMDGARIGSALTSEFSDLSLPDLAKLLDMFYIGGTKNGALLGEALVINNPVLQADFRYHLKQHGALLAKGRVLGSQFLGLFQDDLFFELASHANAMAMKLAHQISAMGFQFLAPPTTNQIFPILPNSIIQRLQQAYGFYVWTRVDQERSAVRLVTSWSTPEARVDEFNLDLHKLI